MSLLDEIRSDLINESTSLSNTLRKAKVLSSEIGLPEFREWVDFELSGYTDRDKVPNYRQIRPTNFGTFAGPFQSGAQNVVLPTYKLPKEVKDFAEHMIFFDGVGALEAQGSSPSEVKWPQEMVLIARETIQMNGGMVLVDAHQPVPGYIVPGILDEVKNKLLDFVLGLQESGVTAEDLDNWAASAEVARNIFYITIYGDRNIVAGGEHVSQQVNPVERGDVASLVNSLRELGLGDNDLRELEKAVSSEGSAPDGNYGPGVADWMGRMIAKAATKAWDVGVETALSVLTRALNGYYGL